MSFHTQKPFNSGLAHLDFSAFELRVAAQTSNQTTPAPQTVTHRSPSTFEPRGYYSPTEFGNFK